MYKAIPARFKLFGQTINVVFKPEYFAENDGVYGCASYRLNEIQLRPPTDTLPLSVEQVEQTFYHELMHFVLYHAGAAYTGKKDYMHQEEGFVDLCGGLLHQAMTTAVYQGNGSNV